MHWPTRPPVVNEQNLVPLGLYRTFTVGYYMGAPAPSVSASSEVLGDLPKGQYTRPACACKILGRKKCPVHGKHTQDAGCPICRSFGGGRLGQGCAEPTVIEEEAQKMAGARLEQGCASPTDVTPGKGSYQGGDIPAGAPGGAVAATGLPAGVIIGIGAAGLAGILWVAGVI